MGGTSTLRKGEEKLDIVILVDLTVRTSKRKEKKRTEEKEDLFHPPSILLKKVASERQKKGGRRFFDLRLAVKKGGNIGYAATGERVSL